MMKTARFLPIILMTTAILGCNSAQKQETTAAKQQQPAITIGGEPVVTLTRPQPTGQSKPQFTQAIVLPGRGMNLLQVKAFIPGKGEVDLLSAPPLPEAKKFLDEQDDEWGNNNFKIGSAVLVPWANRIRGKLTPDGKHIEANVAGKTLTLPAGWGNPGHEKHAIHGLILKSKFQDVKEQNDANESSVSGLLHAGDFGVKWPSQTDVSVQTVLKNDAVEMTVTTKNVGNEPLPMGIALHPYYNILSGDRKQARLHLPDSQRALVNNYDDVFPTGKLEQVKGTKYDFTAPGGKALDDLFMDDNFPNPKRDANGNVVIELIDPAAKYGLRITSSSPEVKAIQVYAPVNKPFVAIEPQFNFNDPYNKAWGKDNGMVTVKPGESVCWKMKLELFVPQAQ